MDEFDTPIFKKSYDLYKTFYSYKNGIPKHERHAIYLKCEQKMLDMIEGIVYASQVARPQKINILERASADLSLLKILIRLMKDTEVIDNKKYAGLQESIDDIGRQLGGWIRA